MYSEESNKGRAGADVQRLTACIFNPPMVQFDLCSSNRISTNRGACRIREMAPFTFAPTIMPAPITMIAPAVGRAGRASPSFDPTDYP
jgi:hypothetical protein